MLLYGLIIRMTAALLTDKSLRYCLGLYLRLKDQVFATSVPEIRRDALKTCLTDVFGDTAEMKHYRPEKNERPYVLITSVRRIDKKQHQLHLFRNYVGPNRVYREPILYPKTPTTG